MSEHLLTYDEWFEAYKRRRALRYEAEVMRPPPKLGATLPVAGFPDWVDVDTDGMLIVRGPLESDPSATVSAGWGAGHAGRDDHGAGFEATNPGWTGGIGGYAEGDRAYLLAMAEEGQMTPSLVVQRFSDTETPFAVMPDGTLQWGSGADAPDTTLRRSGVGNLEMFGSAGNWSEFDLTTPGGGYDGNYAGMYVDPQGAFFYTHNVTLGRNGTAFVTPYFTFNQDGSFHWGTSGPRLAADEDAASMTVSNADLHVPWFVMSNGFYATSFNPNDALLGVAADGHPFNTLEITRDAFKIGSGDALADVKIYRDFQNSITVQGIAPGLESDFILASPSYSTGIFHVAGDPGGVLMEFWNEDVSYDLEIQAGTTDLRLTGSGAPARFLMNTPLCLKSPDGTWHKLVVGDNGALSTTPT